MTNHPKISIVVGSYNRHKFLKLAIESIRKELEKIPGEIIVVDGGSTDETLKWLMNQKDIITIIQHNRGVWKGKKIERRSWGYFMNLGFKCAQAEFVCMLSDDCLVVPNAIVNGYNLFEDKIKEGIKLGALAFYWRNWPDQKKYWVGSTLGNKLFVNHGIYLKRALEDVGYIDEESYLFYHADGDLCLKMWLAGYCVLASPDSYIEHYSHATHFKKRSNFKNQKCDWSAYIEKWRGIYEENANNSGDWVEKEYQDKSDTANDYKYIHMLDIRYRFFLKIVNKMRSVKNAFKYDAKI